jgi:hypothetical protein
MRRFWIGLASTSLLMGCSGSDGPESRTGEQVARQDTLQILEAAVRWVDSVSWRLPDAPIVVIDWPDNSRRGPGPAEFWGGGTYTRVENPGLPLKALIEGAERLENVLVCSGDRGPREERLCDTEPPWRVVVFSVPYVEGDSATLDLDLIPVEHVYDGGSGYLLLLRRKADGWEVAESRIASEVD